jgi:hypothetical protein
MFTLMLCRVSLVVPLFSRLNTCTWMSNERVSTQYSLPLHAMEIKFVFVLDQVSNF